MTMTVVVGMVTVTELHPWGFRCVGTGLTTISGFSRVTLWVDWFFWDSKLVVSLAGMAPRRVLEARVATCLSCRVLRRVVRRAARRIFLQMAPKISL